MDKLAYRIPEAQEVTGLGRTTLYREIKAGRLEAVKVGTSTLITRAALERYLESLDRAD
jgi:excisionase family DNA binding protein